MTATQSYNFICGREAAPVSTESRDSALLLRISRQDRAAFAEFYAHFQGRLFGYLFRLTQSQSMAEDVLQEAMLVVWQKAASYRADSSVSTWLFGIAHHLAMAALRRDQPQRWLDWAQIDLADAADHSPEDDVMRHATAEAVSQALAQLSPDHRVVLELAFYQEFSCKQIAIITEVAEGTVKSRLSYARRALKAVLLRRGEDL